MYQGFYLSFQAGRRDKEKLGEYPVYITISLLNNNDNFHHCCLTTCPVQFARFFRADAETLNLNWSLFLNFFR